MWDAVSGDELKTFAHKHIVKTVAFSSDGKNLLTGSNEKILRIFDLNNSDSGRVVYTLLVSIITTFVKCIPFISIRITKRNWSVTHSVSYSHHQNLGQKQKHWHNAKL